MPDWLFSALVFIFGLAAGSFLNVVIYRLPRGMSIITPASHCPHCGAKIRSYHNVPVLSFLLLRGKCNSCSQPISPLYPIVELTVALLFLFIYVKRGVGWLTLLDFAFIGAILTLAVIDARHRILPDAITYPGFILAIGLRAILPHSALRTILPFNYDALVLDFPLKLMATVGALLIVLAAGILLLLEWLDDRLVGRRLSQAEEAAQTTGLEPVEPETEGREEAETQGHGNDRLAAASPGHHVGERNLPDERPGRLELLVIAIAFVLAGIFFALSLQREPFAVAGLESIFSSLFGAAIGGGFLWLSRLGYYAVRKLEGIGFGDIKMMLMVGAFLGWPGTFLTIVLASVLGSVFGVTIMILRNQKNPSMPFGLFLGMAVIVSFFIQR